MARSFPGYDSDVVLMASGGPSVARLPDSWMYQKDLERRPLLIVDFKDQFNKQASQWSRQRRREYARRDLFGVGTRPAEGRVRRFLAEHQQYNQQARGTHSRRSGNGRRRPAGRAYQVQGSDSFDLEQFATPENLSLANHVLERNGGHAPGIDGVTFEDLSGSEVMAALRDASAGLRHRTYSPSEARAVRLPKGDGRYRELRLQVLIDRTIAKAL